MLTTEENVTHEQILALETEALTVADRRMVTICRIATGDQEPCRPGHAIEPMCSVEAALAECARVIAAAEAMAAGDDDDEYECECECHLLDETDSSPCGRRITGAHRVIRIVPEQMWGSARASGAYTRMGGIEPVDVAERCWAGWVRDHVSDYPRDMIDVSNACND